MTPELSLLARAALLFVLVLLIERYGKRRQARLDKERSRHVPHR